MKSIERQAENFVSELTKEYYKNYSGLKDELNISPIYNRYKILSSRDLIDQIVKAREACTPNADRKLRFLQHFVTDNFLDRGVKELTDEMHTQESKAVIKFSGKDISYRFVPVLISNEENRKIRLALDKTRNPTINKVNVIRKKRLEKLHTYAKELGYKDYIELYSKVKKIDFPRLNNLTHKFLARTEKLYKTKMSQALENLGLSLETARKPDIAFLFRAKSFDKYFKKENTLPMLKSTLLNMGINIDMQKNIMIDLEERKKKSPRAYTFPIKVPDNIVLMMMPHGGQDDYATLLHEAGHTEHYACVKPNLETEYRYFGDNSVTESYAFILEYLMSDRAWLKQYIKMKDPSEYLQFLFLNKLFFLRRYAAKLEYELALHKGLVKNIDNTYSKILTRALKFKHPENHYLLDLDDGFYCAQYLRAWIFEAQLRVQLKNLFGEQWFNNEKSGAFLKNLWSVGQKYNIEEIAISLGMKSLDLEPLSAEIETNL